MDPWWLSMMIPWLFNLNASKLRRSLDTASGRTSRFAWAFRSTSVMAFLWGTNRCQGAVIGHFLFEYHTWSTRTDGCSSNRPKNEDGWMLLTTSTTRLLVKDGKKSQDSCDVPNCLHLMHRPNLHSKNTTSECFHAVTCCEHQEHHIVAQVLREHKSPSSPSNRAVVLAVSLQFFHIDLHILALTSFNFFFLCTAEHNTLRDGHMQWGMWPRGHRNTSHTKRKSYGNSTVCAWP